MVFQIVQDTNLEQKYQIDVVKHGDFKKKKASKLQPEEQKSKDDKFEISSDECLIQDDEIEKQRKMLDKGKGKRKELSQSVDNKSVESPSLEKR